MLATLLVWIYITFLCWIWGFFSLRLIQKISNHELQVPHFSFICLAGLSVITIVAGLLSLFIPLGNWWAQIIFILPGFVLFFRNDLDVFFSSLKKEFSALHVTSLLFLLTCLLLILVMCSWTIIHPDTLGYHAQTIQWIEKFKAVPGLVQLHVRFGYQGLWYVDCALFSFTGLQGITFLSSTVLLWYLIFLVTRIDVNFFREGKRIHGLLWMILLVLSMWSYTQVRLTATSASPDFIATIFVLAIVYLLNGKGTKHLSAGEWLLGAVLSFVAVTIKLSAAPILLVALATMLLYLVNKNRKPFLILILFGLFAVSAFITRNIITSGYVLFPSTAIDIANVDWKYDRELTVKEKEYIAAYARNPRVVTRAEIDSTYKMRTIDWLPGWWDTKSLADKTILILLLISFIAVFRFLKRVIRSGFIPLLSLITMLAGIIFWFIHAPDPRFGFGFILGFMAITACLVLKDKEINIHRIILATAMTAAIAIMLTYTVYRFTNFFKPGQLIVPVGIPEEAYNISECEGIKINSPVNGVFGGTPVPCSDLDCNSFSPRGTAVEDGFRSR